ncbi:MAG: hypothetical protein ACM3SU_15690 [Acidobacteriota bacterium]
MAQTRMFRDRVVSMEQTLEGGEKHLELLKALCLEAFPDFPYRHHALDHERDLFVMTLQASDGRRKIVGWTRMTLFDAERIPALSADPNGPLRGKLVGFLRERANRPEVIVTFRHLEEGWSETPEPRPSRRRRRRGAGRGAGRPAEKPPQGRPGAPRQGAPRQGAPGGAPGRPAVPAPSRPAPAPAAAPATGQARPAGSRRRFRRRRRGRGGGGPAAGAPTP